MSAEEEDRLDFGEDDDDRESEISLGLGGEDVQDVFEQQAQEGHREEAQAAEEEDAKQQSANSNSNNLSAAAVPFDEKQTEDGRPLPAGWIRKISSRGETYFLNLETRKSTWDEPVEPARSTTPPPRSSAAEKPASKREERKSTTKDGNGNSAASYASVVASNVNVAASSDIRQASGSRMGQTVSDDKDTAVSNPEVVTSDGDASAAKASWKRTPQLPQAQVYHSNAGTSRRASDISQLSQPAIAAPPQGPSASKPSHDNREGETREHDTQVAQRSEDGTAPKAARQSLSSSRERTESAKNGQTSKIPATSGLPTGPKADRALPTGPRSSRPSAVQIVKADTKGPPSAPAALAGVPTGPSSKRGPRPPPSNPPGTAPLPRQSGRTDRPKPSMDAGWPKRQANTIEGTVGPAPSPAVSPQRPRANAAVKDTTTSTFPPHEPKPQQMPPTIKSRDSGWGKKAVPSEQAENARDKDTRMRSATPPPARSERRDTARPAESRRDPDRQPERRREEPLPPKPVSRRPDRGRSATPPRRNRQRSQTPPMRKWGAPAVQKQAEEAPPTTSDRRLEEVAGDDRSRAPLRRSRSPSPSKIEKRDASSFRNEADADARSLMSRLNMQRDEASPPPAKRSKREDDSSIAERPTSRPAQDDNMEVDATSSRDAGNEKGKGRSATPPARGISILGASKGKAAKRSMEPARSKPSAESARFVDSTGPTKPDDEAAAKEQGASEVMRLWDPKTGTSTDSRVVVGKANEGTSQEGSKGSRTPSIIAGIAGLPPRPQVSGEIFKNARNISAPVSRPSPEIDSYRPGNSRRDSRDTYRPSGPARRQRSRSPPPSRWSRPRSPSPRDRDARRSRR